MTSHLLPNIDGVTALTSIDHMHICPFITSHCHHSHASSSSLPPIPCLPILSFAIIAITHMPSVLCLHHLCHLFFATFLPSLPCTHHLQHYTLPLASFLLSFALFVSILLLLIPHLSFPSSSLTSFSYLFMLHNTMTDSHLTLFCIVEGLPLSRAFKIEVSASRTIAHLKDLIKTKQAPAFDDITRDQLTLWHVSIPDDSQGSTITIHDLDDKTELNNPRTRLSKLFPESPDDNTYIIIQHPLQGNADALCSDQVLLIACLSHDY